MMPSRTPKKNMAIISLHDVIAMITVCNPFVMPNRSSCSFKSTVMTESVLRKLLLLLIKFILFTHQRWAKLPLSLN